MTVFQILGSQAQLQKVYKHFSRTFQDFARQVFFLWFSSFSEFKVVQRMKIFHCKNEVQNRFKTSSVIGVMDGVIDGVPCLQFVLTVCEWLR